LTRSLIVEFIGSFFLVATIVGSGIMGEKLSNGNDAITLLCNTIATGAILFVIIKSFSNISRAHFNPIVSMVFFLKNEIPQKTFFYFFIVQVIGSLLGVLIIHYIFDLQLFQISKNIRGEERMLISEALASLGLITTILFVRGNNANDIALAVALFISAGYWFTSSTSFANPAVTVARIFTNTFTGIHPGSVLYFITGQITGSIAALLIYNKVSSN